MKKSLPANAFFSVTLSVLLGLCATDALALDMTEKVAKAVTQAVVAQVVTPQVQVLAQANISLVSPVGGETYTNGNRYPVSWHANIPQVNTPYTLTGEIRLIDQNPSNKKDVRVTFLNAQELAKGTYTFLAGAQKDLTYDHTTAPVGSYKVWIYIKGTIDCGPNAKCGPLFEAQATSAGPVTFKY